MSVRYNLVLSDELDSEIENVIKQEETTNKSEIIRKSLQLYLAAHKAKKDGVGVAFVKDGRIQTDIIGI
jgi:metal-responsive CopG/Arc/MetJ family transcriptional regulator